MDEYIALMQLKVAVYGTGIPLYGRTSIRLLQAPTTRCDNISIPHILLHLKVYAVMFVIY